jgi:hypothetical protein
MQVEKRIKQRLDFGIVVHHNHTRRMTGDISEQGCFIKKERWDTDMTLLPIGSEIEFSFDFLNTDNCIDVTGIVVHHGKNGEGMGIWFKKIDERVKEFIGMYLSDYLQEVFFHEPTF